VSFVLAFSNHIFNNAPSAWSKRISIAASIFLVFWNIGKFLFGGANPTLRTLNYTVVVNKAVRVVVVMDIGSGVLKLHWTLKRTYRSVGTRAD